VERQQSMTNGQQKTDMKWW